MATQPNNNSIKVANPPLEGAVRSYLTQDIASGVTTIQLASITGFTVSGSDFYVLIGNYEDEKSEIVLVDASATSGNTLTVSTTTNSHEASDPVTIIGYNQIRYYGLLSADATVYDLLETKNIDVTSQFTEYVYQGTTYGFFATSYYNSNADEISGYSETIQSTSFTRRSAERIIRSAALKALTTIDENPNSRLTWDIALTILQDGLDEIGVKKKRWAFWNTITNDTTTVSQNYIEKPTDLTQLVSIKVDGKKLDWVTRSDYNAYTSGGTQTGIPSLFTEKNEQYFLYPIPDSAYDVTFEYYRIPEVINDMSTEIAIPMVPLLIYYCGSQYAYIRGNDKKGDNLYAHFDKLLNEQLEEYGGPEQDGVASYVEQTSTLDEGAYLTY